MPDHGKLRFMRTAGGLTHHNAFRKKLSKVTISRLAFLDDHGMLTDISSQAEEEDWGAGGTRYVEKQGGAHWLAEGESYPASVTKGTRLRVEVDLAVECADADPIECLITATPSLGKADSGAPEAFTFRGYAVLGGEPTVRVMMTAVAPLADQVFLAVDWTLSWTAHAAARPLQAGVTGPHRLYVTYGKPDPGGVPFPRPYGVDDPPLEDGITDRRMHAAVDLIERQWRWALGEGGAARSESKEQAARRKRFFAGRTRNDPHLIVGALMAYVPGYTLAEPPEGSVRPEERELIKETYGHPGYFPAPAGAWPIYRYADALAECQAIVRFVRGVLMQAGVPGEVKYIVVYADPGPPPGPEEAQEDSIVPPDQDPGKYEARRNGEHKLAAGLHRKSPRVHAGRMQKPALTDSVVRAPEPGGQKPEPIPHGTVLNAYEACLRFAHAGETYYYGGGVPLANHDSPQQVIRVFKQLVWCVETDPGAEDTDHEVTEIAYPAVSVGAGGEPEYYEPDGDPNRWRK